MVDGQFRYKTNNSNTEIELTHMDKDDVKGESRHAYSLRDDRTFKNTLIPGNNGEWDGTLVTSSITLFRSQKCSYGNDSCRFRVSPSRDESFRRERHFRSFNETSQMMKVTPRVF